jgi:hypothetical protein
MTPGRCSVVAAASAANQTPHMARHLPQPEPFRCHVVMPDGSVAVVFASTSSPASAAQLLRASFGPDDQQPARIIVYRGGKSEPIGDPLLEWTRS